MTTIADVHVHLVQPRGPVEPSPGSRLEWCVVEVVDSDGVAGFGEATNWLGTGSSVVAATLELLRDVVVGRDAARIGDLWNDLFRRFSFLGSRGLPTAVISGIDTALWDRKGKALGRSVADLLGGPVQAARRCRHPRAWTSRIRHGLRRDHRRHPGSGHP